MKFIQRLFFAWCPMVVFQQGRPILSGLATLLVFFLIANLCIGWDDSSESKPPQPTRFDRVAEIFQTRCLSCHSGEKARAGLDLSSKNSLLRGSENGPVVVSGHADQSLLHKIISGTNPRMPQRGNGLAKSDVSLIGEWINAGLPWPKNTKLTAKEDHENTWWAFRPLQRPEVPKVKNTQWGETPIDAFVLAKLEKEGLSPNRAVDRLTFLRRAKMDLHGLPPTLEEIATFLDDQSPDAIDRLLDRLLNSHHYGERWGRHWLDVVHYADTHGFDKDKRRLWAWRYRDWVIDALNQDIPYDEFIRQQIAGDVIDKGKPGGIIAAGFVVAGPWDFVGHVELREGTIEKEKTRSLDRDDMVANTMSTFQSMTVHCARCHDHKFDPILQNEYYQLQAVFAGVERGDRSFERPVDAVKLRQISEKLRAVNQRKEQLAQEIDRLQGAVGRDLQQKINAWQKQMTNLSRPVSKKGSPTNGYHSQIAAKANTMKWVQVDLGKIVPIDTIRIVPARPTDFPDTPGFGFPVRFDIKISNTADFANPETLMDYSSVDFANPGDHLLVLKDLQRKARYVRLTAHRLWERRNDYALALAELQVISQGKNIAAQKAVQSLDTIEAGRWSQRHLVDGFDSRKQLPKSTEPKLFEALETYCNKMANYWHDRAELQRIRAKAIPEKLQQAWQEVQNAETMLRQEQARLTKTEKTYSVRPIAPRPIHRLRRGEVEKKEELVGPGSHHLIDGLSGDLLITNANNEGERRVALANFLADKKNVLTWRSIVNRVWHYHFGRGIVDSPNDFGKNGSLPSHPELLDWLAVEFRDNGMSLKKLHKLIMRSAVYRQSCEHNPANAKIDAGNQYLWRMNRRKLDAESIRDAVLSVSGKLDLQRGGPGFDLFAFKDDHSPHYDHSAIEKINDPKTFRRTVYRFTVRSVPNPFLDCLDCADPNVSVPKRNNTLTALQALALLNNPFMLKQAEYFAERLESTNKNSREQIQLAYRLCYARNPSPDEMALLLDYRSEHGLRNLCLMLFNSNEFLFVD